ncbi:MAG: hypothetical protein ACRYFK_16070 [Janthinobacterium lividum]
MKQDISFEPVAGVSVAVVPDQPTPALGEAGQAGWTVYLLNNNDFALENVLVSADGYGTQPTGEAVRTSTLRYHFAQVAPRSATAIELITPAVFHLTNQYWVSYYVAGQVFDKKFLFVPGAIDAANLSRLDLLAGQVGVLHS